MSYKVCYLDKASRTIVTHLSEYPPLVPQAGEVVTIVSEDATEQHIDTMSVYGRQFIIYSNGDVTINVVLENIGQPRVANKAR